MYIRTSVKRALRARTVPVWASLGPCGPPEPLWAPLGSCGLGPCGPPCLGGRALEGPLGPCGPDPWGPPLGLHGPGPCGQDTHTK